MDVCWYEIKSRNVWLHCNCDDCLTIILSGIGISSDSSLSYDMTLVHSNWYSLLFDPSPLSFSLKGVELKSCVNICDPF